MSERFDQIPKTNSLQNKLSAILGELYHDGLIFKLETEDVRKDKDGSG